LFLEGKNYIITAERGLSAVFLFKNNVFDFENGILSIL